jgi:acyl-coenzyme A thioesterase PaaI-like protein
MMPAPCREASPPLRAEPQAGCVVCGPENPRGLQIRFATQPDGAVTARWTPAAGWEGFRGIIHGGIVSTVLDEAMSKAVAGARYEALTAELRVRFRRPVEPGTELRIRGWVAGRRRRLIDTEATLTDADGAERAHAWAAFLLLEGLPR